MATVPRLNPLSENKNNNFKILKNFFRTLHIISGLDFGFFEKSKTFFGKLITLIHVLFVFYACTQIDQITKSLFVASWVFFTVIHYILTVLCSILTKPKKLEKFFTDLETIDIELKFKSESIHLETKLVVVGLFHIVLRFLAIGILVIFTLERPLNPVLYGCLLLWLDISLLFVHISYAFVFYAVNYRLKKLDEALKTATLEFSSLQRTYKSIVDITEGHKTAFDPVFTISLVTCIPEVMLSIYYAVFQAFPEFYQGNRYLKMEYFLVIESFLVIFAPAVCAGQLSTLTDKIKCTLHEKLMEDMDTRNIREIERFIRYVEARSCRFRVYKVIPLDANLIGMVLSFCATYLIVIIQFTK